MQHAFRVLKASGRSGWNLVTSSTESDGLNFSFEKHQDHALRYERAREFYDVVAGLSDSWEDDAFVRDKASGAYLDPNKLRVLQHRGKHFGVRERTRTSAGNRQVIGR